MLTDKVIEEIAGEYSFDGYDCVLDCNVIDDDNFAKFARAIEKLVQEEVISKLFIAVDCDSCEDVGVECEGYEAQQCKRSLMKFIRGDQ